MNLERSRRCGAAALLAALAAGCAGAGTPAPVPGCSSPGSRLPDSVSIAFADPVRPERAPVPGNRAERTVFGTLYQTLVAGDCAGNPGPGLARSWETDGTTWTFTLDPEAVFWDGSPVTARDVVTSWLSGPDPALPAGSVSVAGEYTVRVELTRPTTALRFADPALAVVRRFNGISWPMGTGPWQTGAGPEDAVILTRNRGRGPGTIVVTAPANGRDAIDRGHDLIVDDSPATIDYARNLGLAVTEMPWDRVYVLTGRLAQDATDAGAFAMVDGALRVAYRRPRGPFWWSNLSCADTQTTAQWNGDLLYEPNDRVAGELAGRIVTVLSADPVHPLRPAGLAMIRSLPMGSVPEVAPSLGQLRALPLHAFDECALLRHAGAGAIVPLVETRGTIVSERPLALRFAWDGGIVFSP